MHTTCFSTYKFLSVWSIVDYSDLSSTKSFLSVSSRFSLLDLESFSAELLDFWSPLRSSLVVSCDGTSVCKVYELPNCFLSRFRLCFLIRSFFSFLIFIIPSSWVLENCLRSVAHFMSLSSVSMRKLPELKTRILFLSFKVLVYFSVIYLFFSSASNLPS